MVSFFPACDQTAGTTRVLLRDHDGSVVRRTVLPTGLRVVSESVPATRSVAVGVWAMVGSRDESAASAGAAHFLEHLLFKGTAKRSALEIASELDAVGGEMNAFTTKEYTCFYARVLQRDLALAVDVLMDLTTNASLRKRDIEAERPVVLEEISMHEDDPADRVHEALQRMVLSPSRLALPVLGTRESIASMKPSTLRSFYGRRYRPEGLVVTAAGDVDHANLLHLIREACESAGWPWGIVPKDRATAPAAGPGVGRSDSRVEVAEWPGEQCNVAMGTEGLPRAHRSRRMLDVLNTIIGGGMSSRLFQSVREERSLAYSIYTFHTPYVDTGVWGVTAGCNPDKASEVLALIRHEYDRILRDGVTDEEVARAKGHLSGSLVLAGEDPGARMTRLGRCEVATGELLTIDESLEKIDAVTIGEVNGLAADLLTRPPVVAAVGPVRDIEKTRDALMTAATSSS